MMIAEMLDRQTIFVFRLVCRSWREVGSEVLFGHMHISIGSEEHFLNTLSQLNEIGKYSTHVSLRFDPFEIDKESVSELGLIRAATIRLRIPCSMACLCDVLNRIERVEVYWTQGGPDVKAQDWKPISQLRPLETLNVSFLDDCTETFGKFEFQSINLRRLVLNCPSKYWYMISDPIFEVCQGLEWIELSSRRDSICRSKRFHPALVKIKGKAEAIMCMFRCSASHHQ